MYLQSSKKGGEGVGQVRIQKGGCGARLTISKIEVRNILLDVEFWDLVFWLVVVLVLLVEQLLPGHRVGE